MGIFPLNSTRGYSGRSLEGSTNIQTDSQWTAGTRSRVRVSSPKISPKSQQPQKNVLIVDSFAASGPGDRAQSHRFAVGAGKFMDRGGGAVAENEAAQCLQSDPLRDELRRYSI